MHKYKMQEDTLILYLIYSFKTKDIPPKQVSSLWSSWLWMNIFQLCIPTNQNHFL